MLDKIGGNKYGTAKRVSPVIVKVPFVKGGPEGFLDGVRKVYDDYKPKYEKDPKTATAVLSMSWGYPEAELGPDKDQWMDELKLLLQKLISMGILPVTGSGNGPPWNTVSLPSWLFLGATSYKLRSQSTGTRSCGGATTSRNFSWLGE